jgi:hypothetical protein
MRAGVVIGAAVVLIAAGIAGVQFSGLLDEPRPAIEAPARPAAVAVANVMVIADDAVVGGVARDNLVFDGALAAFEDELRRAGFTLHDGRAVTVVNSALDNERRSDAEIAALARRQQPRVEAIVLFSLLTPVDSTMQAQNASIRATARILRAADGRGLNTVDWTSPMRWSLPYACDRACLIATVGVEAPAVVTAVGERAAAVLRAGS